MRTRSRSRALIRGGLVGVLFTVLACGGEPPDSGADQREPEAADTAADSTAQVQRVGRAVGFFVMGPDHRDFIPCFGELEYWVDGPALPDLIEVYEGLVPETDALEAVYVDMLAQLEPPPRTGPGRTLAATLFVLELRRVAWEGFGCREDDQELLAGASGNEPFWSFRASEAQAILETPDGQTSWTPGALEPSPEGWRMTGGEEGSGFTLTLELGGCVDSMSGAYTHVRAVLALDTPEGSPPRRFEGCGWIGPRAEL